MDPSAGILAATGQCVAFRNNNNIGDNNKITIIMMVMIMILLVTVIMPIDITKMIIITRTTRTDNSNNKDDYVKNGTNVIDAICITPLIPAKYKIFFIRTNLLMIQLL